MSFLEAVLVLVAGLAAGTINTVVGSGTLVTFPALLAIGYPPVVANVSNNVGLVPGGGPAAWLGVLAGGVYGGCGVIVAVGVFAIVRLLTT